MWNVGQIIISKAPKKVASLLSIAGWDFEKK